MLAALVGVEPTSTESESVILAVRREGSFGSIKFSGQRPNLKMAAQEGVEPSVVCFKGKPVSDTPGN